MKAKDIVFELEHYFVLKEKDAYTVMVKKLTHSQSIQSFKPDSDGLSLAISYSKFLNKRIKTCKDK